MCHTFKNLHGHCRQRKLLESCSTLSLHHSATVHGLRQREACEAGSLEDAHTHAAITLVYGSHTDYKQMLGCVSHSLFAGNAFGHQVKFFDFIVTQSDCILLLLVYQAVFAAICTDLCEL